MSIGSMPTTPTGKSEDPLAFYDILPTDHGQGTGMSFSAESCKAYVEKLYRVNLYDLPQGALDDFQNALLNGAVGQFEKSELLSLADQLALQYVEALANEQCPRRKRMSIQRLNYFLRAILDRDVPIYAGSSVKKLGRKCPWDWIERGAESVYVTSEEQNVVYRTGKGEESHFRLGLPTQVDDIDGYSYSVGSTYSPGYYCLNACGVTHIPHDRPVLIGFEVDGVRMFLDADGNIVEQTSGECSVRLGISPVSKARVAAGFLYIMSWVRASLLYQVDLSTWEIHQIHLADMFLVNDIMLMGNKYYLIDKEQGNLFEYDTTFSLNRRLLGFGRGAGRLFDPIAVRGSLTGCCVDILNWVPGTIVSVPLDSAECQ